LFAWKRIHKNLANTLGSTTANLSDDLHPALLSFIKSIASARFGKQNASSMSRQNISGIPHCNVFFSVKDFVHLLHRT